jgi:hypothetical protein
MAKSKKEVMVLYVEPKSDIFFYVGEKYYRRLFPIPYAHNPIDIKKVKKDFSI